MPDSLKKTKAFLDKSVERLVSRKFLAWIVATCMVFYGILDGDNWVAITLTYIGTQALVDTAVAWKHGPSIN